MLETGGGGAYPDSREKAWPVTRREGAGLSLSPEERVARTSQRRRPPSEREAGRAARASGSGTVTLPAAATEESGRGRGPARLARSGRGSRAVCRAAEARLDVCVS